MPQKRSAMQVFGANVYRRMKALGRKSPRVAKDTGTGMDPKTVRNIVKGSFSPTLDTMEAIARALETPLWRLLVDDTSVTPGNGAQLAHLIEEFQKTDETGRHSILAVAEVAARSYRTDGS